MKLRGHVPYSPYYAIAGRSFSPAQDWTVNGVNILTVHYYGATANFGLPAFVTIGDGTKTARIYIPDYDSKVAGWNEMNVSLPDVAAAGVDLTNILYGNRLW